GNNHCFKGPRAGEDRVWVVKDGNVTNVAIWIRPPADKYFAFTGEEKKSWPDEVIIDQPFCHFEPHVSVAFVPYFYAKDSRSPRQKIKTQNRHPISHNTKWKGDERDVPGGNVTIAASNAAFLHNPVDPDLSKPLLGPNGLVPVRLKCDIHKWMEAYIWVLE